MRKALRRSISGVCWRLVTRGGLWAARSIINRKTGANVKRGIGIASVVLAALADRRLEAQPQPVPVVRGRARSRRD